MTPRSYKPDAWKQELALIVHSGSVSLPMLTAFISRALTERENWIRELDAEAGRVALDQNTQEVTRVILDELFIAEPRMQTGKFPSAEERKFIKNKIRYRLLKRLGLD